MEKMDLTTSMSETEMAQARLDAIRARLYAVDKAPNYIAQHRADKIMYHWAQEDLVFLLAEIDHLSAERDTLSDELIRLKSRETARVAAHLHIDTEPKRRKTVNALPYIGITTVRGVLQEGGCIAIDLKGTEALITAQNVAVGRLRPGTKNELRDAGELPIMATGHGSFVTYSQHVFLHDPAECKV